MAEPVGYSPSVGPAILDSDHETQRAAEFVMEFVVLSARKRRIFEEVWHEVLSNYLVTLPGGEYYVTDDSGYRPQFSTGNRSITGMSRLRDPETHMVVESLASQAIGLAIGPKDYLEAIPVGMDDYEAARIIAKVIMADLEGGTNFRKVYGGLKDQWIFGTAIFELGWELETAMQMVKKPLYDQLTGQMTGHTFAPEEVVRRYGSLLRSVDIWDFYPDPSGTRIQEDMQGCAKKFRLTAAQAMAKAEQGVYDKAAVRRAIDRAGGRESSSQGTAGENRWSRTSIDLEPAVAGRENMLLTGLEYWGEVPYRPSDKARRRVITLLEGQVARNKINPYIDGNIPFKEAVCNPINGRFWGVGAAEVIRFLQDSADNMLMAVNDGVDQAAAIPLLVGMGFNGDTNQLRRREPYDIIMCNNPDAVKPVPFDYNAMQLAAQDLMRRKMQMREASGSLDPQTISNQALGDRAPATQVSEVVRLASQRMEIQVQILERDFFPWLGSTMHSRLRQFAPPEGGVAVLEGERVPFSIDDIDIDIDVRFTGSRRAMSSHQKFQQYQQAFAVMSTNPQFVAMMPELAVRLLRDGMDIDDAPAMVAKAVEAYQMLQQQQAALQGGGAGPGGGGAPPAGAVNTLNQPGEMVARAGTALA